jgi:hypothetical protein
LYTKDPWKSCREVARERRREECGDLKARKKCVAYDTFHFLKVALKLEKVGDHWARQWS